MKKLKSKLYLLYYDALRWSYKRAQNRQVKALALLMAFEQTVIDIIKEKNNSDGNA